MEFTGKELVIPLKLQFNTFVLALFGVIEIELIALLLVGVISIVVICFFERVRMTIVNLSPVGSTGKIFVIPLKLQINLLFLGDMIEVKFDEEEEEEEEAILTVGYFWFV